MRKTLAFAVALAAVTSACAGPRAPLQIGSKDVAVDIVLGQRPAPLAPPSGSSPTAGFPGFIQPPVPRLQPGVPPPPVPPSPVCPEANPLAPTQIPADFSAPAPALATYQYRNKGQFTVGGGVAQSYPETMTRRVSAVRALEPPGNFEADVVASLAGSETTTTYRVLNEGNTPDRGLYIAQIVTRTGSTTEPFTPDRPILLLPFPAPEYGSGLEDEINQLQRQQFRSAGTDPLTQTTMVLQAQFIGKVRINACGEWVDSFEIDVTEGRIFGPTKQLSFTGTKYFIAPQYGALIVQDDVKLTGTENDENGRMQAVDSANLSTINVLPKEPA